MQKIRMLERYEELDRLVTQSKPVLLADVSWIDPNPLNGRYYYDPVELDALASSIKEHGVMVPLLLRRVSAAPLDRFQIVSGHRRFKAALLAGQKAVPYMLFEGTEQDALYFRRVENLQRVDLNPFEEATEVVGHFTDVFEWSLSDVPSRLLRIRHLVRKGRHDAVESEMGVTYSQVISAYNLVSSRCSFESFVANRLPVLSWPGDLIEALRLGAAPFVFLRQLRSLPLEQRRFVLARLKDGVSATELAIEVAEFRKTQSQVVSGRDLVGELRKRLRSIRDLNDEQQSALKVFLDTLG